MRNKNRSYGMALLFVLVVLTMIAVLTAIAVYHGQYFFLIAITSIALIVLCDIVFRRFKQRWKTLMVAVRQKIR